MIDAIKPLMFAAVFAVACASPERPDDTFVALPQPDPAANKVQAQALGHEAGCVEAAYTSALQQAIGAWATEKQQGTAYAETLEPEHMQVGAVQTAITHASLQMTLAAEVYAPHKKLKIREGERVAEADASVLARSHAEAETLLLSACKTQLAHAPAGPGENIDILATGAINLLGVEGIRPFRLNRYGQHCEAYATTSVACRQPGIHPQPNCTYEDGDAQVVSRMVSCTYAEGTWLCEDTPQAAAFPPEAGGAVAEALNQEILKILPVAQTAAPDADL